MKSSGLFLSRLFYDILAPYIVERIFAIVGNAQKIYSNFGRRQRTGAYKLNNLGLRYADDRVCRKQSLKKPTTKK